MRRQAERRDTVQPSHQQPAPRIHAPICVWNQKGFYQLKEEMLPVFTRHHQFFVMDAKKNQMKKVLPEKIVHPDAKELSNEVPVKNTTE